MLLLNKHKMLVVIQGPRFFKCHVELEHLLDSYEVQTSVHIMNVSDHLLVTNAVQCTNLALLEES